MAYEAARQLADLGQQVALLALLNLSPGPLRSAVEWVPGSFNGPEASVIFAISGSKKDDYTPRSGPDVL